MVSGIALTSAGWCSLSRKTTSLIIIIIVVVVVVVTIIIIKIIIVVIIITGFTETYHSFFDASDVVISVAHQDVSSRTDWDERT